MEMQEDTRETPSEQKTAESTCETASEQKTAESMPETSSAKNVVEKVPAKTVTNNIKAKKTLSLCDMEYLYKKYFSGNDVKHRTVIIMNLFNVINIANANYTQQKVNKSQTYSFKLHTENVEDMMLKLITHFVSVVSKFEEDEFVWAIKFYSSCLVYKMHTILDSSVKGTVFTHFKHTMKKCLKTSNPEHLKIISIVTCKTLSFECRQIISNIGAHWLKNPDLENVLPLFFMPLDETKSYFREIIAAVNGNACTDLGKMIDKATLKYLKSSTSYNLHTAPGRS